MAEWKNSHNFGLENLDNYICYILILLILYYLLVSWKCLIPEIAGGKIEGGGHQFCGQDHTVPALGSVQKKLTAL